MPVTITLPRALRIVSTAAMNGAPKPLAMAAASAVMPSDSVSSVRSAQAMAEFAAGFGFLASDALIFARVLMRNSNPILLRPGREGIGESAIAGRALLHGQDGAAAVVIHDGNVEPRLILEQLQIALDVGVDRRQPDQEETVGDLDRETGQRDAARLLGILHQNAGHVGNAATGEI